jgi:hypothetical protein
MKPLIGVATLSLMFWAPGGFLSPLWAQCDVRFAIQEARDLQCIREPEMRMLEQVLSESETSLGYESFVKGSKVASRAYHCLLSGRRVAQDYRCFSEALHERLYSRLEQRDLCFNERLTRSLAALNYLLQRKLPVDEPLKYQAVLDRSLSDFRVIYGVIRQIQEEPEDPVSLHLAARSCVDMSEPFLSPAYVQEFIRLTVAIALAYPDLTQHLSAVLEATLRDAVEVHRATASEESLREVHELLVDFGAAFSDLYAFREELERLLPQDQPSLADLEKLLDSSDKLRSHLEMGASKPKYVASLYEPFEEYSDVLHGIVEMFHLPEAPWDLKDRLMWESCTVLATGIELSTPYETTEELERVRTKLIDRVRNYGSELARELKYSELITFESQFLDQSERILTSSQQCHIHAHLAQAFYVLEQNREALQQLEASCGLISQYDLRDLREVIEPWLN